MRQNTVYRYCMSFKKQVIEKLEAGRFRSINQAKEHCGIRGEYTIRKGQRLRVFIKREVLCLDCLATTINSQIPKSNCINSNLFTSHNR